MEVKADKFIEMVSRLSGVSPDIILNNIVTGYLNNGGMVTDLITPDEVMADKTNSEESVESVESVESEESDTPVSEDLPKDDSQGELFTGKDGTERRSGPAVPIERRTDHKGIVYPSQGAMCKAYGIIVESYRYRREKMGWSLEKALTTPISVEHSEISRGLRRRNSESPVGVATETITFDNLYEPVVDHKGRQFPNFSCMCAKYGLLPVTVTNRLNSGWELERALTTPVKQTKRRKIAKEHIDHTGKPYKSQREMCAAWHINPEIYRLRRNAGWNICRSLTVPVLTHQSDADLLNCKEG